MAASDHTINGNSNCGGIHGYLCGMDSPRKA